MLLKEVDKSNLKTTKLLDYALIGVCEVITCRLKMIGTKKKKIYMKLVKKEHAEGYATYNLD